MESVAGIRIRVTRAIIASVLIGALIAPATCAPISAISPVPSTPTVTPTTPPPAQVPTPTPTPVPTPPPMPMPAPAPKPSRGPFVTSNLTVTPNTVRFNEPATAKVTVTNNSTQPGTYPVVLTLIRMDGRISTFTQKVTLAGGTSQTVSFTLFLSGGQGTHMVIVDDLRERVSVDDQN